MTKLNKQKYLLIHYVIFMSIFLISCTEQFTPKIDKKASILVVDGRITNDQGPYEINLFKTAGLDRYEVIKPETGAIITIHDNEGSSDTFIEMNPGQYQNMTNKFKGKIGNSYWVEIETSDGKKYESTPETIPPQVEIEKIYGEEMTKIMTDGEKLNGAGFFIDAKSSTNQDLYLKWDYQESWEWQTPYFFSITDNPARICYPHLISNKISIFDGSQYNIKQFNHLSTSFINQNEVKLKYAYFLNVSLYSISFESYEFWNSMQKINQSNGGIYDNIPSNKRGNIYACDPDDSVLGYFEASSVNTINKTFSTADFEMEFSDYPKECESFKTLVPPDGKNYVKMAADVFDGHVVYTVKRGYCFDCNVRYSPLKPSFWP